MCSLHLLQDVPSAPSAVMPGILCGCVMGILVGLPLIVGVCRCTATVTSRKRATGSSLTPALPVLEAVTTRSQTSSNCRLLLPLCTSPQGKEPHSLWCNRTQRKSAPPTV